jgi:hypothetical protein
VRRYCLLLLLCSAALSLASCRGPREAGPAPITTLTVQDRPADTGGAIELDWSGYVPPADLAQYRIYRGRDPISTVARLKPVGSVAKPDETTDAPTGYIDTRVTDGLDYYYAVTAVDADGGEQESVTGVGPVQSARQLPGPAPPSNVQAQDDDAPDDPGGVINVSWTKAPDDTGLGGRVTGYQIVRLDEPEGEETVFEEVLAGRTEYTDKTGQPKVEYYYGVRALAGEARSELALSAPIVSRGRWYNPARTNVLAALVIYGALVLFFISRARRGHELYVRPIAGLQALDDAIGRATEMGRPILYVSGLGDASDISTIAAMIILGRVARRIAEYETPLLVPCRDPIVMSTEREIVRQAYLEAGHADAFDPDSVFFLTESQFAYVGAIDGIMLRERPATNIYMGRFFAESLILAETGASTGAIQIAGTASDTQLPFFITTCDYTLMGEELYAATAYLSREPLILGSLKGQDWGKVLIAAILIAGAIITTLNPSWAQRFVELFAGA